ncbi:MAG TPA: LON peptidase substrate-binding domain-containing protein [Candidatus Thermoplasmatota archaeon]|nr:LON peptidase substrate-binding domain-containing protein [Candidatus Thermoplasmatota archaeon]
MERIPLFPLDLVAYPGESLPLHIFEERYLLMVEEALAEGLPIGLALARQDQPGDRVEYDPEDVGTAVEIVTAKRLEDGRVLIDTVATRRFRVERVHSTRPFQEADVTWLQEQDGDGAEEEAASLLDELSAKGAAELAGELEEVDPATLSYAVASAFEAPLPVKQHLLEMRTAAERLRLERALLRPAVLGS